MTRWPRFVMARLGPMPGTPRKEARRGVRGIEDKGPEVGAKADLPEQVSALGDRRSLDEMSATSERGIQLQ